MGVTLLFLVILMNGEPLGSPCPPTMHRPTTGKFPQLHHMTAGFSIDTIARVDNAARLGITTAFIYGTPFTPSDPVGREMLARGMHEIDAGFSSDLYYYECHRTHVVMPPPNGEPNEYCPTDILPSFNSETALLAYIDARLQADAHNPLIVGYWVLDDWVLWDSGSAKGILQEIHRHIVRATPSFPAICGIGVTVSEPETSNWEPGLALNYSNAGCDMIGIYAYAPWYPQLMNGSQFDFTMRAMLPAVFRSLQQQGWSIQQTPLIGIGQAYAGLYTYAGIRYQPIITREQIATQAQAFCQAGAISIGWYAWNDSGFTAQTLTPMTSTDIQQGIVSGRAACQGLW